jgi:hypothetical protein
MNRKQKRMLGEQRPLDRLVMRPGAGWKHLAGPVWEHPNGARIHTMGMIQLPDKTHLSLNNWRESEFGWRMVRINGGNRKRGLMAWVMNLVGA